MHLKRLELRDFRAFPEAEWDLSSAGLVLVAGANNSGKSALLSAIDIVAGRASPSDLRFHGTDSPARIEVSWSLTESERAEVFGATQHAQAWLATSVFAELETMFSEAPDGQVIPVEWRTRNIAGEMDAFITSPDGATAHYFDLYSTLQ